MFIITFILLFTSSSAIAQNAVQDPVQVRIIVNLPPEINGYRDFSICGPNGFWAEYGMQYDGIQTFTEDGSYALHFDRKGWSEWGQGSFDLVKGKITNLEVDDSAVITATLSEDPNTGLQVLDIEEKDVSKTLKN